MLGGIFAAGAHRHLHQGDHGAAHLAAIRRLKPDALAAFARIAGLDIGAALAGFGERVAALDGTGFNTGAARYRAAFGRPLDYYTGLVFEISAQGAVLAGGGRFDRLLTLLGARTAIPAVGFSLWLDRIALARSRSKGDAAQ